MPQRCVQAWQQALAGSPQELAGALAEAARAGDPQAALHYGQCLLDGRGVAHDAAAALGWFHKAAQAGLAEGMNMVGRCLDQGWGAPQNPEAAAPWFRLAAQRGLDWGQYNLATLLALGRGVAQDRAQALDLFRKAAAQGHAKSMTMVGSFYEDGWSVPANLAVAAYHYARGAEGGDFRGCFNHARMELAAGREESALLWLGKAAALGHPAFVAQMAAWLHQHPEAALKALAARLEADLQRAA